MTAGYNRPFFSDVYPYNDTSTNMLSNTKIYGRVKNRFPWSLVTAKPLFYVCKFGRRTQVTL